MRFLKALDTDGETVFFSVDKILTLTPKKNGCVSVLLGGGLYWHIKPETMIFVELGNIVSELLEAKTE